MEMGNVPEKYQEDIRKANFFLEGIVMWLFVLFVLVFIAGSVVITIFILGLVFGGECPYDRRLFEMSENDNIIRESNRKPFNQSLVDDRSVHLHDHNGK
ncbi:MAG: hypothetical protein FWC64_01785 [Treponema sp.]|nr:hypothetical protein [Treponema sp.]